MKIRYRMIARRKIEASRRLRLRSDPGAALPASLDDPMEMPSEVFDLATTQLPPHRYNSEVLDLATTELPPYRYKKGRP